MTSQNAQFIFCFLQYQKASPLFSLGFNPHNCPGYDQIPPSPLGVISPCSRASPPLEAFVAISTHPKSRSLLPLSPPLFLPILDRSRLRRPPRRRLFRHHSRPTIVPISSHSPNFAPFVPPHLQLPHHHRRGRPTHLLPSHQTQRGHVWMGDGVLEGGSVFNHLLIQIHPFRKHIWSLCALCLLLSLLIILNSVLIISIQGSSPYRFGDPTFVIFSEVLAWLLILVSVIGVKLTCMSTKIVETNSEARRRGTGDDAATALPSVSIEVDGADLMGLRRPFSAPHWVNAYWGIAADGGAAGEGAIGLPGVVEPQPPFDPFLFPPPPPRYSSLGGPSVAPRGAIRPSSSRPLRPCHQSAQLFRSPPPPYCPALSSPRSVVVRPSLFPSAD